MRGAPGAETRAALHVPLPIKIAKRTNQSKHPRHFPGSYSHGTWLCLWSSPWSDSESLYHLSTMAHGLLGNNQYKTGVPEPSDSQNPPLVPHKLITAQHLLFNYFFGYKMSQLREKGVWDARGQGRNF